MSLPLKESCLRILTVHSAGLVDVGYCAYRLIRPVLFACPPDQLSEIEDRSPHIMLESDEIWALHLKRDYPREEPLPPVKYTLSRSSSSDSELQEVDLPPNRVKYYDTKQKKAEALASASLRLREQTQANRSDLSKRKAIFTGMADPGLGNKRRKLNGPKAWGTPVAAKTLAEKARQQVKKSAAVYANASRPKPTPPAAPLPSTSRQINKPTDTSTSTSMFSVHRRSPNDPASKCVVRNSSLVVKVVSVKKPVPLVPSQGAVKPTPFGSRAVAPPIRVVRPIDPIRKPLTNFKSSKLTPSPLPNTSQTSSIRGPSKPVTGTQAPMNNKAPSPNPTPTFKRKQTNLFMPKTKKPPPPAPSRSLVSVPAPSSLNSRMSQPPRR